MPCVHAWRQCVNTSQITQAFFHDCRTSRWLTLFWLTCVFWMALQIQAVTSKEGCREYPVSIRICHAPCWCFGSSSFERLIATRPLTQGGNIQASAFTLAKKGVQGHTYRLCMVAERHHGIEWHFRRSITVGNRYAKCANMYGRSHCRWPQRQGGGTDGRV